MTWSPFSFKINKDLSISIFLNNYKGNLKEIVYNSIKNYKLIWYTLSPEIIDKEMKGTFFWFEFEWDIIIMNYNIRFSFWMSPRIEESLMPYFFYLYQFITSEEDNLLDFWFSFLFDSLSFLESEDFSEIHKDLLLEIKSKNNLIHKNNFKKNYSKGYWSLYQNQLFPVIEFDFNSHLINYINQEFYLNYNNQWTLTDDQILLNNKVIFWPKLNEQWILYYWYYWNEKYIQILKTSLDKYFNNVELMKECKRVLKWNWYTAYSQLFPLNNFIM